MSELWTEIPELVELYDIECASRHDHDFYLAVAAQVGATSVVDVGCGTGVFAVDLAARGFTAIGVDPASPMLDIARQRSAHTTIEWVHGDASDIESDVADLVVMMGHVAQYFVEDDAWRKVLADVHRILKPGGHLTFETRNPTVDWSGHWTREKTTTTYDHPGGGHFTSWVQVVDKTGTAGSYAATHEGHSVLPDGRHLVATETLRFRSDHEVHASLAAAGFVVTSEWGDWDRSPVGPLSPERIVLAERLTSDG